MHNSFARALAEAPGGGLLIQLRNNQAQPMVTLGYGDGQQADALWRQMQHAYRGKQSELPVYFRMLFFVHEL